MKPHQRIQPPQVKLLNVAMSQLGLDRQEIKDRYGVKSTKELTNAQFDEAMRHFEACGFVYRPSVKNAPKVRAANLIKQRFLSAIEKLLHDLGKDWAYAEGIGRRMFGLEKLEWAAPEQLHKVQIALIYERRKQVGDPVPRRSKRVTG